MAEQISSDFISSNRISINEMVKGSSVALFISLSTLLIVAGDFLLTHIKPEQSNIQILNREHKTSKFDRVSGNSVHYIKIQNTGSRPGIITEHHVKQVNLIDWENRKKIKAGLEDWKAKIYYGGLKQQRVVPAEYIGYMTATSEIEFKRPRRFTRDYDEIEVLLEFEVEDHTGTYTVKYWDRMERGYFEIQTH